MVLAAWSSFESLAGCSAFLLLVGRSKGQASGGQAIELADALVESPGGHDAAQYADASGPRAGGVAQLRLPVGRRRDDRFADDGGIVAALHRRRQHVVEDAPLLRVDRQRAVGAYHVRVE